MASLPVALARRSQVAALLTYLSISALLFGRAAAHDFNSIYLGNGIDQSFFIWCLVWWPYAIAHGLNPFVTKLIFAPAGFNLTWSTSIPLISLLAYPLTTTIGPIAAFNLLWVIFPALSAWTAFLLCRSLTANFWPSILGGYIFGFSSYMVGHMFGGHLNLLAAFLIPLAVSLVLARLRERVGQAAFTVALLLLLTAQFLIATEVLATMTMFGGLALAAAWMMGDRDFRRRFVRGALGPIFLAYLCMALLVSPYLYYLFAGFHAIPLYSPSQHSTDLLNFIVPTRTIVLGARVASFDRVAACFTSNLSEQGGYVGLPLLGVALLFVVERRRTLEAKLLASMVAIIAVAAMGPRLHVAGQSYFKLPWSLLHHAALIDQALPLRFTVYLFLALAVMAAMWLAEPGRALTRTIAGLLIVVSFLPNPSARMWAEPGRVMLPAFFATGAYRRYLAPGEIVATLPYANGATDLSMLWQALSGMNFRLAGGYPALSPLSYARWPIVRSANQAATIPDPALQWKAFASNHGVTAAIKSDAPLPAGSPSIDPIVSALGAPVVAGGGITLYRIAPAGLAPYRALNWTRMEALADEQRFDALLVAAQRYFAAGADPSALSITSAVNMGILPSAWVTGPSRGNDYRLYMQTDPNGLVTVGVMGTHEGLLPLVNHYRALAQRVQFDYVERLDKAKSQPPQGMYYYPLRMSFDRAGLARAAALALRGPPLPDPGSRSLANRPQTPVLN